MITPIITQFTPINATESNNIKFTYTGQNQIVKNNMVVETLTGVEIYNQIQNTFNLWHSLPINTIVNGNTYRVKIRTADINNVWSNFSDFVIFYALALPTISILSIDVSGHVYNQTIIFQTSYSHPNSELLQSYRYYLYDSNKNLKMAFPEVYSDGKTLLTQEITGLNNGEKYFLEVKIVTVKGQVSTTGKIDFIPSYTTPKMASGLFVENVKEQGSVKISTSAKQIMFKVLDNTGNEILKEDIVYINNTKIDMNKQEYEKLISSDGFYIEKNDFILQVWLENIVDDEILFKIFSPNGWFEIIYYNNCFHCFKRYYDNNLVSHFISNNITLIGQTTLLVKQIGGSMDLIAQNI